LKYPPPHWHWQLESTVPPKHLTHFPPQGVVSTGQNPMI
jgi:hypothetical protein